MRGYVFGQTSFNFTGVILGEDRQTVLAHICCFDSTCWNADTGEATRHGRRVPALDLKADWRGMGTLEGAPGGPLAHCGDNP